jgi:hypothetical protein
LGERESILVISHLPTDEKTSDLYFAGLAPQRVSVLYFSNQLELTEGGIKNRAQRAHGAIWGL